MQTNTPQFQWELVPREQVEVFLGSLPWPAIALDPDGRVTYANEHVKELWGLQRERMQGRHLETLLPDYVRALRGDPPWMTPQEAEISRPRDRGHVHERVWVRTIPGGAYLLIRDETAALESEREQAQTARLASVGFMLAGVCHEVSNPLAATYSMVQILQSQNEISEEVMRDGLDRIAANVKRILEVSRRINEFCRIGKPVPLRVDDAVREALAMLHVDARIGGVTVEHRGNAAAIVASDIGHLRQVFYNLVLNACQAMAGAGKVVIRSERESSGRVSVFVEDTGPGIPSEHLDRLFDPFFTTKPSGEGTGLGLCITRDLVREHGGVITAANQPDGGACFHLEFPGENSNP
jgi:signal transduction histidine kinase